MKAIRILVLFALMFSVMSVFLPQQTQAAAASSATQALKADIDAILDVFKAPEFKADAQKQVRRQKVRGIILNRFDFERMAQYSLGKNWRGRTLEEKHDFTILLQRMIEDKYISKLDGYSNEKVVYLNEQRKTKRGWEYAKVQTKVVTADGTQILIVYMMHKHGSDPWQVYDINIAGVSMVNNYRSQFVEVLDHKSFPQLLKDLDAKNSSK